MFGKLLGHLQKAKTNLDNERGSKFFDLNSKAKSKAETKIALDRVNIQDLRMRQFENQQKDEEAKVQMMEKQIEEKELLLLQVRLEKHYGLMMNFIRTKAEPTIFYLPSKHTKETESMLEETRDAIKHKITSLKVQLQPIHDDSGQGDGVPDAAPEGDKTKATGQDTASKEEAQPSNDEKGREGKEGEKSAHEDSEEESVPRGAPASQAEADAQDKEGKDAKESADEKERDDEKDEDKSKDKDDRKDEEAAPPKKKRKKEKKSKDGDANSKGQDKSSSGSGSGSE